MATVDRFEYFLPCGHRSAGLVCFQCACEELVAGETAADKVEPPGSAGPSSPSGHVQQTATIDRFEYLLPCGHKSVGLVCFHCASEAFVAGERAADKLKPVIPGIVPRELTIAVTYPPHTQRFAARPRKR